MLEAEAVQQKQLIFKAEAPQGIRFWMAGGLALFSYQVRCSFEILE